MHKTSAKNKYDPYKHPSKHQLSNSTDKVNKSVRQSNPVAELTKQVPKLKQKFINNTSHKFNQNTNRNKKNTRATSANGKDLQKKDKYFVQKIKQVTKNIRNGNQLSSYPTPILTPNKSNNPQQIGDYKYISKESYGNVQRLKAYLQQSTSKINNIKRKSDQIIIDQVRQTQNNLVKRIVETQKQNSISMQQDNQKICMLIKQNQKLKSSYFKQISDLRTQLKSQKDGRKIAEDNLVKYKNQIQLLQSRLKAKQQQKKTNHTTTIKKDTNYNTHNYQQQIQRLKLSNRNLQTKLKECQQEKKFIKKNAVQFQPKFKFTQKQPIINRKR